MATQGFPNQISEFNSSSWSSWVGRLQFYFEANNITDPALKRANLLTLCEEQTYNTVCALIQPSSPAAVSYDDIVAALQKHYDPRPSEVYSRARFQRRAKLEGETVSAYIAALMKLASNCNFLTLTTTATGQERHVASPANTTMLSLDVMLRDRFVCGLSDESLQPGMFAEKDLTFNEAYDIAVRAECAGHKQTEIHRNTESVHQTSNQRRRLREYAASDVHGTTSAAPSVVYDLNTMNLGTRPKTFTEFQELSSKFFVRIWILIFQIGDFQRRIQKPIEACQRVRR
ncbi:hypothetical protein V5799_006010 [Amblyomma americanum]|uniref:Retrotransposon gag domain-containing protein n=1 Tax=Amblyomma americanum TaxID=6943 RepID=A0AAQ4DXL9_AMBAM